jgi:hypothetical protein
VAPGTVRGESVAELMGGRQSKCGARATKAPNLTKKPAGSEPAGEFESLRYQKNL